MSERRQRLGRDQREAAKIREQAALERAKRSDEHGNALEARCHRNAAAAHAHAALAAEALRRADVALEGEQLGEAAPGVRRVYRPSTRY